MCRFPKASCLLGFDNERRDHINLKIANMLGEHGELEHAVATRLMVTAAQGLVLPVHKRVGSEGGMAGCHPFEATKSLLRLGSIVI